MTLNNDTGWNNVVQTHTNQICTSFTDLKEGGIMTKSGFLKKPSKGKITESISVPILTPQTTLPTS